MEDINQRFQEELKWKENFIFPEFPFFHGFHSSYQNKFCLYNVDVNYTSLLTHPAIFLYFDTESDWLGNITVSQLGQIIEIEPYLNPSVEFKINSNLKYKYLVAITGNLREQSPTSQENKKANLQIYALVAEEIKNYTLRESKRPDIKPPCH